MFLNDNEMMGRDIPPRNSDLVLTDGLLVCFAQTNSILQCLVLQTQLNQAPPPRGEMEQIAIIGLTAAVPT